MRTAVAEVKIGTHYYRLVVTERTAGIFSTSIYDLDQMNTVISKSGPRTTDGFILNQTFENALEDAEIDLFTYTAQIGELWPKGIRIEWAK